jgi:2-amino-4-hydroxy-6-hydroxymethyldihydropteridine diphosphokinase
MPRVYVSIGSNIEREQNIRGAARALAARFGRLTLSSVYETGPVGFEGDNFYNLVAGFDTEAPVEEVRRELLRIESDHGRRRETGPRHGPRTLDLDILLYGNLVRHKEGFDIPRGEIGRFAYVLRPLAEIAPGLKHPETGKTLEEMWDAFDRSQLVTRIDIDPGAA